MSTGVPFSGGKPKFSPGVFQMGHVFQRGDLPLYVSDAAGNPLSPQTVRFTLFRYNPGNPNPVQIGPADRTPVQADIGEYYVTGIAGECGGQPGDWFVRWTYQYNSSSPMTQDVFAFKVFNPNDYLPTCATKKLGWD